MRKIAFLFASIVRENITGSSVIFGDSDLENLMEKCVSDIFQSVQTMKMRTQENIMLPANTILCIY